MATEAAAITSWLEALAGVVDEMERENTDMFPEAGRMLGRCLLERSRCEPPMECLPFSWALLSDSRSTLSGPGTTCNSWLGHEPDLSK